MLFRKTIDKIELLVNQVERGWGKQMEKGHRDCQVFFIQRLSIWQRFYQCLLWVLCHVVIPLHVFAVDAKHCNTLVYHLSNVVPYLFPGVQIHSKRYCFHFMDVAST